MYRQNSAGYHLRATFQGRPWRSLLIVPANAAAIRTLSWPSATVGHPPRLRAAVAVDHARFAAVEIDAMDVEETPIPKIHGDQQIIRKMRRHADEQQAHAVVRRQIAHNFAGNIDDVDLPVFVAVAFAGKYQMPVIVCPGVVADAAPCFVGDLPIVACGQTAHPYLQDIFFVRGEIRKRFAVRGNLGIHFGGIAEQNLTRNQGWKRALKCATRDQENDNDRRKDHLSHGRTPPV
jgi:hypothetical protein